MNKLALYCRPGFEKECAAEITEKAAALEVFGFPRVKENSGYVTFECYQHEDADKLAKNLPFRELIFARQMIVVGELLKDLPTDDRVSPIVGMLMNVIEG
ncbi:MAG: 23S rRNA (cytidine(2498)-2'-O)-methyltransferase RlmM, partial [Enterobacterales bacterium]|nr:23S rRNA (cytidine(2498)-2'-O)-methyltransferase RlmM [Enterobacterales bacterium]